MTTQRHIISRAGGESILHPSSPHRRGIYSASVIPRAGGESMRAMRANIQRAFGARGHISWMTRSSLKHSHYDRITNVLHHGGRLAKLIKLRHGWQKNRFYRSVAQLG